MTTDCYVFSPNGTGRALAESLGVGQWVDLTTPEDRADAPPPEAGALFTLIFPVYAHRVPAVLARWLRGLPPQRGVACLMAVYGGAGPGRALHRAKRLVERAGWQVAGAAELPGPHCYDMVPGVPRAERNWTGVETFYTSVLERAETSSVVCLPRRFDLAVLLPQRLLAGLTAPFPGTDHVRCRNCRQCKAKCPVGAIPDHPGRCIRCAACVRSCPAGAREFHFYCKAPARYIQAHMAQKKEPRFY